MKTLLAGLVALAAAASPGWAQSADCNFALQVEQVGNSFYEPTAATPTLVQLRFSAAAPPSGKNCQNTPVTITAADGGAFRFALAGTTLATTVVNSNQVEGPTTTRIDLNGNARKTIVDGGAVTVNLFSAAPGQFLRGGTYEARLSVRVGTAAPVIVPARLTIRPTFRFLPDNGSSTKNLSFGEVTNGGTRESSIFLQTNSDVLIRASSLNRGRMLHEQGETFGFIDYVARYNDQALDLSSGATTINRLYSGMQTQIDRLAVSVAPQSGKFAGKYRDVIVLEFIAN